MILDREAHRTTLNHIGVMKALRAERVTDELLGKVNLGETLLALERR